MRVDRARDFLIAAVGDARAGDHDNVNRRQTAGLGSKRLSNEPLDPVALGSQPGSFFRNGKTESRTRMAGGRGNYREQRITARSAVAKNIAKLRRISQALFRPEPGAGALGIDARPGLPPRGGDQALRRARPLARRRAMICRPLFVAIRARKPWVRLRRRLLG